MPSAFRPFRTGSTIDPATPSGRHTRTILNEILGAAGHPVEPGMETLEIRNFQKDFGLAPDGIVRPGGPTENMMNAIAVAGQKGGPVLVESLKSPIRSLARQGLTWSIDPRNPDALGMWRDSQGRRVDPERAGQMIPISQTGTGEPPDGAPGGAAGLLAERMVGKTGRDRIMAAPQTAPGDAPDPFEMGDNDSFDHEPNVTSGSFRRGADRVIEGVDRLRREQRERAPDPERRPPHRDVEKIEWEKNSITGADPLIKGNKVGAKVGDAIRLDLESDAIGIDGARVKVEWHPLDARGRVVPECRRPDHRRKEAGGHVLGNSLAKILGVGTSQILLAPYPNEHGFRVEVSYEPQASVHGNTRGVLVHISAPVNELKSVEPRDNKKNDKIEQMVMADRMQSKEAMSSLVIR